MRIKTYVFVCSPLSVSERYASRKFYISDHAYYVAMALLKTKLESDTYLSLVISELGDINKDFEST